VENWNIEEHELSQLFKQYYAVAEGGIQPNQTSPVASDISIVLNKEDFTTENRTLLANILSAIGQNIDQCYICALENTDPEPNLLDKLTSSKAILTFGMSLQGNPILYQVDKHQTSQLIAADTLSELSSSQDKKRLLWTSLKQLKL
jgi:DNA polymerase III psi subunit